MLSAYKSFILLILLISIAQFGTSFCLPALPALSETFSIASPVTQATMTWYAIGLASSSLFYGPASDRWNRKSVVLIGLTLFTLGTGLALSATSFPLFLAARGLQGLGMGCANTLIRAILRDLYQGKNMCVWSLY